MYRLLVLPIALALLAAAALPAGENDPAQKKKKKPDAANKKAQLFKGSPEEFLKRHDKNNDGALDKDEAPPPVARAFDKADRDGNGKLDAKELGPVLARLQQRFGAGDQATTKKPDQAPTSQANAQQLIKRFDKDGDGKLDARELQQLLAAGKFPGEPAKPVEPKKPGAPVAGQGPERLVANILQRMDADKDGKVSKGEAQAGIAKNFGQIDANKDGFLDKEELMRVAKRMAAAQAGQPDRRPGGPDFDAMDKDADGRLTAEELKGTPLADKFAQIDADKDGKLNRKEFDAYVKKQAEKK